MIARKAVEHLLEVFKTQLGKRVIFISTEGCTKFSPECSTNQQFTILMVPKQQKKIKLEVQQGSQTSFLVP